MHVPTMLIYPLVIITLHYVKVSFSFHNYDYSTFKYAEAIENYLKANTSEISLRCSDQLNYYVSQLKNNQIWALQVFDANGKIPSGVLGGNLYGLGAFDQCLAVEETNITTIFGQYCLGSIKLNRIFNKTITEVDELRKDILVGICMPSGCSKNEISDVLNGIGYDINLVGKSCKIKTASEFKPTAIITLTFFAIILTLIVVSTTYHVFLYYSGKKPKNRLVFAFSILKNGKQLFQTNNKSDTQISCLHGVRTLTMFWIIYINQCKVLRTNALNNLIYVEKLWLHTIPSLLVDAAPVAVDTFFLIAGVVVSYNYLNSQLKHEKFSIAWHYTHRYLRLTVVLSVVILIMSTLFEHLGSGPLWPNDTRCKSYWWAALLYIQNYVISGDFCVPQSWYLCVDMQLFFLSPLFLIPLRKWPKPTIIAIGLLAVCTTIIIFVTTWILQFHAVSSMNTNSADSHNFYAYYYYPTHTRGIPWFLGIILGYFIFQHMKTDKNFKFNKIIVVWLWFASIGMIWFSIFLLSALPENVSNNNLVNALFTSLRHPLWSMGVSWIIFACVTGYGRSINWFLSLPIFEVLAKFTYNIYLVHYFIIRFVANSSRTSIQFDNTQLICMFCGNLMLSLGAAILLAFAFELPAAAIEKHILSLRKTAQI